METLKIFDNHGNLIDAEIVFAFNCKTNQKNYIALNFKKNIFEDTSRYNNLDIVEITKEKSNTIEVSDIPEKDWEDVKQALQNDVFSKI